MLCEYHLNFLKKHSRQGDQPGQRPRGRRGCLVQTTTNWRAESMGRGAVSGLRRASEVRLRPLKGIQIQRAHRGMAQKFLSGCSGVECVCVCVGRMNQKWEAWLQGAWSSRKSTPPHLLFILSSPSHLPLPLSFPALLLWPTESWEQSKELGRASRPGSTGGQTEAQRAEGPCPEPHSSQDHTGVKGHLGAQSGSSFHQWRRPSIKASGPPRTNESVCVSTAS